jgi:hypothetical protein
VVPNPVVPNAPAGLLVPNMEEPKSEGVEAPPKSEGVLVLVPKMELPWVPVVPNAPVPKPPAVEYGRLPSNWYHKHTSCVGCNTAARTYLMHTDRHAVYAYLHRSLVLPHC